MLKFGYAIVFVSDMKRSIEFYRDVLGLPLRFESQEWTEFDTSGYDQGPSAQPSFNSD